MTKNQASQLGQALVAWSQGTVLETRHATGLDKSWYPFTPEDCEKINVEDGIEWREAPISGRFLSKKTAWGRFLRTQKAHYLRNNRRTPENYEQRAM